jgi:phosphorylcholine metabolism protein LicD
LRETGETQLKSCQLVLVRMLKVFDFICQSHGISYWLTAGTLIGALRHRGIIPWDCDIDVGMTLQDLAAFASITHELPADMFFQSPATDPPYLSDKVWKLRDRHSNYYEWQKKNPQAKWHNGLQVDLIEYAEDENGKLINPFRGTAYDRQEIFPLETVEFEGALLLAPRNPDQYIMRRYGDYIRLPPFWKRRPHEGKADPFQPCQHPESRPFKRRQ